MTRRARHFPHSEAGLTLAEVLVVLGVIALLMALLLPALSRARATSMSLKCASNLRQLGAAMHLYAGDSNGYVPRDHSPWRHDRRPYWMIALGPYVDPRDDWDTAGKTLTRELDVLQCPAHPLLGEIPGCFVVNAFRFETKDAWQPAGPVALATVQNPSGVVFLAEATDLFGDDADTGGNAIYEPRYHDAWRPADLPGGTGERISDARHRESANVLFFDNSLRTIRRGEMKLEWFDDGVTQRPAPGPWPW